MGHPFRHEPPPYRNEPPKFAIQTEPPPYRSEPPLYRPSLHHAESSLRYTDNEPPLYRTTFFTHCKTLILYYIKNCFKIISTQWHKVFPKENDNSKFVIFEAFIAPESGLQGEFNIRSRKYHK